MDDEQRAPEHPVLSTTAADELAPATDAQPSPAGPSAPEPPPEISQWHVEVVQVPPDDPHWGSDSDVWKHLVAAASTCRDATAVRTLADQWRECLEARGETQSTAFGDAGTISGGFVDLRDSGQVAPLWFIGDVHGDIVGLETALAYIDGNEPGARICFLGDLFDRGYRHGAVLYRVLELAIRRPHEIVIVVGNHDEGLYCGADLTRFSSTVQPSEACDWLNDEAPESPWRELARCAIDVFKRSPRALLLPDGLLVAHGGVPHVDLLPKLNTAADLNMPDVLEDFVWTRLHETARKRVPNRVTRGCSLGIEDFELFCATLEGLLHRPVRGMIRGHDHLEPRFKLFSRYEHRPVLTVNTMSHRLSSEIPGDFRMPLVVARYTPNTMPTVHRLEVPSSVLNDVYGDPETGSPTGDERC